jgi:hypothetical protein
VKELQKERLVSFMGALSGFMATGYCRYWSGGGTGTTVSPLLFSAATWAVLVQVQGLQAGLAVEGWQMHQGMCSRLLD